ncbi:hypothetical protein [Deinococcus aquaticus]|uniref:Uncharacterized protein n=1 Tax=Deinococcus aquaticus TaxID=328692 RepID=A0ABY7V6Q0_9DEIO|nr:hypothetical protein [Deinococcus aquaticus]WDA60805.1 hypothetical protein M8445_18040 [Deinococcus aquaticus]
MYYDSDLPSRSIYESNPILNKNFVEAVHSIGDTQVYQSLTGIISMYPVYGSIAKGSLDTVFTDKPMQEIFVETATGVFLDRAIAADSLMEKVRGYVNGVRENISLSEGIGLTLSGAGEATNVALGLTGNPTYDSFAANLIGGFVNDPFSNSISTSLLDEQKRESLVNNELDLFQIKHEREHINEQAKPELEQEKVNTFEYDEKRTNQ